MGDAQANDVLVQPDGKIVAGGSFEVSYDNNDFALIRYESNGAPDTAFGRGGIALTDIKGGNDEIAMLALQADNKIVATSQTSNYPINDFAVARYTPAGRPDRTFGRKGTVATNVGLTSSGGNSLDLPRGAALGPDGKILVVGETNAGSIQDFDFVIARYLP